MDKVEAMFTEFQDKRSRAERMRGRVFTYYVKNSVPTLYYNKMYKNEYLPTRVRYNHVLFVSALAFSVYYAHTHWHYGFAEENKPINERRFYTFPTYWTNWISYADDKHTYKKAIGKQKTII